MPGFDVNETGWFLRQLWWRFPFFPIDLLHDFVEFWEVVLAGWGGWDPESASEILYLCPDVVVDFLGNLRSFIFDAPHSLLFRPSIVLVWLG